jgi:hypothetical protein
MSMMEVEQSVAEQWIVDEVPGLDGARGQARR